MNCRTCKHNVPESVTAEDGVNLGTENVCHHPEQPAEGLTRKTPMARAIGAWIVSIDWDDELLCPTITEPCPGFEVKS